MQKELECQELLRGHWWPDRGARPRTDRFVRYASSWRPLVSLIPEGSRGWCGWPIQAETRSPQTCGKRRSQRDTKKVARGKYSFW